MTNKPIRGDGEAKNGHMASFADFQKIDIRMGTVVDVQAFPEAHKPAWKLWVNFGADVGVKKSSAQITVHYDRDALLGRQVMAVVNFPPRQIGPFLSEILVLGFADEQGDIRLASADAVLPNGARLM